MLATTLLVFYLSAVFGSSSEVQELTAAQLKDLLTSGAAKKSAWLLSFNPKSNSETQKLASALAGIVRVGTFTDFDNKQIKFSEFSMGDYWLLDGTNESKIKFTSSPANAQNLLEFVFRSLQKWSMAKAGLKSGGSSSGKVIDLTDASFDREISSAPAGTLWFVEFFAPWCGHCKNLAPQWKRAAQLLETASKVKLAAVDATKEHAISARYKIQGFPTIKIFTSPEFSTPSGEYEGPRSAEGIRDWILKFANEAEPLKPSELLELTEQSVFDNECKSKQICLISFLPDLLDCQSECRNKYLALIRSMSEKYAKQQWGYVWTSALAQPSLEDSLDVGGSGYPAMVALNFKKKAYANLRGSFSENGINEFLRDLSYGRGTTGEIRGNVPEIESVEKWDGKDAVVLAGDEEIEHQEL